MLLETLFQFEPQKHAFFINSETTLLKAHQSTDYLAFTTRNNELILHNTKTGRSSILLRSEHGFFDLQFTNEHLLAVEQSVHQILIFSLKNEKLKKKITGHQSQITKISYCRQLSLIASISHDQCIIFSQKTFVKQKTLKCSTSSFIDCSFSMTGNILTTVFKDGTIFIWNPENYSHTENFLPQRGLKVSLNYGSVLSIYNNKALYLADLNKQVIILQEIDKFWQGSILQVNFLQQILLLNTDKSFYLVKLSLQHKFIIHNIKEIKNSINLFTVAEYQSILILVSKKLRKITINKLSSSKTEIVKQCHNPLTNEGLVCAGGYSNTQGCFTVNNLLVGNNYQAVTQQVQKISKLTYQDINTNFSLQKLRQFVRKHHCLPDRHRPMAYRYLLQLPISPEEFRKLESKGRHSCSNLLDSKYPLKNLKLRETMKDVLSILAHYHPIFAQTERICEIIFPFVCLFGNDLFLCFEILYSLFTRQLSFLFEEFPVANSAYLQNMYEILNKQDKQLVDHLKAKQMSFTKLSWNLLSNLFATNLPREHFLTIIDSLFVRPNQPQYLMFLCLGYLIYNKARLLSIKSDAQMNIFLEQEHTIHIAKYLATVDRIYNNQKHNVRYDFKMTNLGSKKYQAMCEIPQDALLMHQNKRKLLNEQLLKRQEEQIYRDRMLQQMQNMAIKAKREAERQMIEKQSYELHCQNQSNNKLTFVPTNDSKRIIRIQRLMDQLSQALSNQSNKKQSIKNYMPSITNLQVKSNEQLQKLENKLANLLTEVKPGSYVHSYKNQPFAIGKQNINDHNAFKANINTNLAGRLWQLQNQFRANKNQKWQNNILYSINK